MRRREVLLAFGAAGLAGHGGAADEALVAALREGRAAVLLRHAITDPGVGDPPGFRPGDCATQRQLSTAGRDQAGRIGAWFNARALKPAKVRSSAWCRCLDTATLAFGRVEPWPALDSLFDDRSRAASQSVALGTELARIEAGRFEVWVTHQVNITAFIGESVPMGGAWVVRAGQGAPPKVHNLGRLSFDA